MPSPAATLRLSAAVLLAFTALAQAGPADDLSRATTAALAEFQVSGAAIGEAREDGQALVLGNITYATGGERPLGVKITRARVSGAASGEALSGASVVLEGVEGTGAEGSAFTIPRVELSGTQGSLAAILAVVASPEPFLAATNGTALTRFSAQRIDVPAMTVTRRQQAKPAQAAYRELRLDRYDRGKVGETTIAGSTVTPLAPSGPRVETGSIRLTGYDLTAGTRTGGDAASALESGAIEAVRGTSETGAPFTIERIVLGRVTMRPGERSLVALSQSLSQIDPASADEASRRATLGAAAEVFARLDMERVEMVNLRGQGERNRPFTLERFVIAGLSQGRIATLEFTGLAASDQQGQKTVIGRFGFEGIDASGLVALGKDYAEGRFTPGGPPPPAAIPDVRRFVLEDVTVTSPANETLARLGRLDIESGQRIAYVPTRIRARVTGFEAPVPPAQRAQVAPIGLTDKINLTAELEVEYVDSARELRLRTLNTDVTDVGALNVVLTIGGIDRAAVEGLPGTAAMLGLSAKAGRLVISYKENGGVASLLSHTAEQAGVEEEEFTEQLKQQLGAMVGQFVQDRELARRLTGAINTFLDDPGSLVITATPKGDMPLAALAVAARSSPFALIPMFDIQVEANR